MNVDEFSESFGEVAETFCAVHGRPAAELLVLCWMIQSAINKAVIAGIHLAEAKRQCDAAAYHEMLRLIIEQTTDHKARCIQQIVDNLLRSAFHDEAIHAAVHQSEIMAGKEFASILQSYNGEEGNNQ